MTPRDLVLTPRGLRFRGVTYPCTIGKGRLSHTKREGDGATPIGHHRIVGVYFRPDRLARPNHWAQPIGPRDLWSDAEDQPDYNQPVKAPYAFSHEALRRADPLYDLVLITDWNYQPSQPGRGSAIFVHQWRRQGYPTEGCIAFRRDHLHKIAQNLRYGDRLIVPPLSGLLG